MIIPEHFSAALLPTPIVPVQRFFNQHSGLKVWLKRDDFTGLELSGNKVRKLDFLLKEAVDKKAQRIITCGALQSNHCRATAYYAARLGLKTTLVLRGQKPDMPVGNYLLDKLLEVDVRFVTAEEYASADLIMNDLAERSSEPAYVIPEGGSNEVGFWGYINCFFEIQRQIQESKLDIDTIVVATGSGGTHGGLLLGKLLTNSALNVVSINVGDNADYFIAKIDRLMQRFAERFGYKLNWTKSAINIIDGFVGEGYGAIGAAEVDLIRRFARSEGIVIDPVYGAKAMLGLEHSLANGKIQSKNIMFIHTGGIFGIFPYGQNFQ